LGDVSSLMSCDTDLASPNEGFWNFPIASAVTCHDQIGHPATFEEGCQLPTWEKHLDELDHLHETQSDHRGLRVVTQI